MNFIVALQAEAMPLIDRFNLVKRSDTRVFPIFENKDHRVIISGIGRINAAAATGYLYRFEEYSQGIVNIGIAGHGELSTGTSFLANRILHSEEKTVYYPPPILEHPITTSALQTCDTPEKLYPHPIGYDMEAHAICSIAYRLITRELVQIIKIVSDNPSNPLESFSKKTATNLIASQLTLIEEIVEQMDDLSNRLSPDPVILELIEQIRSKFHFSSTQTHQLEKLVKQANALGLEITKISSIADSADNAKNCINFLRQNLEPIRRLS